jgi:hypothetical protein
MKNLIIKTVLCIATLFISFALYAEYIISREVHEIFSLLSTVVVLMLTGLTLSLIITLIKKLVS